MNPSGTTTTIVMIGEQSRWREQTSQIATDNRLPFLLLSSTFRLSEQLIDGQTAIIIIDWDYAPQEIEEFVRELNASKTSCGATLLLLNHPPDSNFTPPPPNFIGLIETLPSLVSPERYSAVLNYLINFHTLLHALKSETRRREQTEKKLNIYSEQLKQMRVKTEGLKLAQTEIAALLVDEIRTPLNIIQQTIKSISRTELKERAEETLSDLGRVSRQATHALRQLKNIIEFEQIGPQRQLEISQFSPDTVIETCLSLVRQRPKGAPPTIMFTPGCAQIKIGADQPVFQQIVLQLLEFVVTNLESPATVIKIATKSIQAMNNNGKWEGLFKASITANFSSPDQSTTRPDASPHAPFSEINQLILCKRHCNQHRGDVWQEKNGPHETTFAFLLPGITQPKSTIMVVDDEPDIRFVTQKIIEKLDFFTESAENGAIALEKLAKSPVDLILLDLKMPIMGGVETLIQLRNNNLTKDIPVIIHTSHLKGSKGKEVSDLAQDIILKPGSLADFQSKITTLLPNESPNDLTSILLIESHPGLLEKFKRIAQRLNHQVIKTCSNREALYLTKRFRFSLVSIDSDLQSLDEIELVQQIRAIAPGVCISLTAEHPEKYQNISTELGIKAILSKGSASSQIENLLIACSPN